MMNYPALYVGQAMAQSKLALIEDMMSNLSASLAPVGLNSSTTRMDMNGVINSSDYIIDLLTMDRNGLVLACEPAQYHYMEELNFSTDTFMQAFLQQKMPRMSNVFLATEGVYGASLVLPVFDLNGSFLGGVGALLDIRSLVDDSIAGFAALTGCSYDCVQKNGLIVASNDPAELSLNVLTSPHFSNYTSLRMLAWRMVNETAGYGEYSFPPALGQTTVVLKDMFWLSIGFRGIEWRLCLQKAQ
ncbi:MAG: PDC sensor domain-containing protein, partial [Methanomassiliicoccales archaeon]